MAVTTIHHKSTQETNRTASPIVKDVPAKTEGKLRVKRFIFEPATGTNPAALQNIAFSRFKKGDVLLGGVVCSNGAVATANLEMGISAVDGSDDIDGAGTADDPNFFSGIINIDTAGDYQFGETLALKYGYECLKEVYLTGSLTTAGMTGGTHKLIGHVLFMETA
jgi:hypothetical protein